MKTCLQGFASEKIIKYYLARDLGFKIQDSRFDIQDWKIKYGNVFQEKSTRFRISRYVSTIDLLPSFYFTEKFMLSYAGVFHKNSLSVPCCTFNVLEVRTITPNTFKNQSGGTLKIFAHHCNHQQGLVK